MVVLVPWTALPIPQRPYECGIARDWIMPWVHYCNTNTRGVETL